MATAVILAMTTTLSAQAPAQGAPPAPPAAPAPPNAPAPGPTYAVAQKAIAAAHAAGEKLGVRLSCAVVDSRGDLVAMIEMLQATGLEHIEARMGQSLAQKRRNREIGGFPCLGISTNMWVELHAVILVAERCRGRRVN
jgi:hypothetical protein